MRLEVMPYFFNNNSEFFFAGFRQFCYNMCCKYIQTIIHKQTSQQMQLLYECEIAFTSICTAVYLHIIVEH